MAKGEESQHVSPLPRYVCTMSYEPKEEEKGVDYAVTPWPCPLDGGYIPARKANVCAENRHEFSAEPPIIVVRDSRVILLSCFPSVLAPTHSAEMATFLSCGSSPLFLFASGSSGRF